MHAVLGTICSGTDSPLLVWRSICRVLQKCFGIDMQLTMGMQCEADPGKQAFLQAMFPLDKDVPLFEDATTLHNKEAADARKGGRASAVPSVTFCLTGFPCQDVSRCNPNSKSQKNRDTIRSISLRTGKVFNSVKEYYKEHGECLEGGLCENVGGLADVSKPIDEESRAPSNLDVCVHALEQELAMHVLVFGIDPAESMGLTVHRFRYWILHLFKEKLGNIPPDCINALARKTMDVVCGASEGVALEDLLLREDDQLVLDHYSEALAMADRRSTGASSSAATSNWASSHYEECIRQGKAWWDCHAPPKEVMDAFPGLHKLSARELDILACSKVSYPEKQARAINLAISFNRTRLTSSSVLGCTLPTMKEYITSRCRVSLGLEAMHFQNIHYAEQHRLLRGYSSKFLQDLAGNAFEARTCAAASLTMLVVCSHLHAQRASAAATYGPPRSLKRVLSAADSSDDEERKIWQGGSEQGRPKRSLAFMLADGRFGGDCVLDDIMSFPDSGTRL